MHKAGIVRCIHQNIATHECHQLRLRKTRSYRSRLRPNGKLLMARRVFFSFHFANDFLRTQQVRNMIIRARSNC